MRGSRRRGVRSAGAEVDYQGGAVEQARLDGAGAPLVDDDGVGAGGHHIADEAAESGGVGYWSVGHGMIHGYEEKFSVAGPGKPGEAQRFSAQR